MTTYPVLLPDNPHGNPVGCVYQDEWELWWCRVPLKALFLIVRNTDETYLGGPFGTRYDAELEAVDVWDRAAYMNGRYDK